MSKTWFTSDTHFGSERTMRLSKRPFKTVKDMDDTIIENWNSVVDKEDVIIHAGDFGEYEVAKKLNGKIILVLGNYEEDDIKKDEQLFKNRIKDSGIVVTSYGTSYLFKTQDGENIGITHKPTTAFVAFESEMYDFTLFGHIHKLQMVKEFGLNVGIDCHNFTPIDIDTVMFYKNAIENHYDADVFC